MEKANKKIKPQGWMVTPEAKKLMAALKGNARFVGGCVRDALLGKKIKDIDIATPYTPEQTTKLLEKAKIRAIPTGIKHGTVTALINKKTYEITTLRKDMYCDGRHAQVEFTDDWEEDAARRDFTMNALYLDAEGNIYDYFGGIEDLKKGIVRFIGNPKERVREDYLRILRFFRFSAQYSKQKSLHKESLDACAYLKDGIEKLSGERIQTEMFKLLSSPDPDFVLSVMYKRGIWNMVAPGKIQHPETLKKVEYVGTHRIPDPCFRLAYFLSFSILEESEFKAFAERWKLSTADKNRLKAALFPKIKINSSMTQDGIKKILRKTDPQYFIDSVRLSYAAELVKKKKTESVLKKKYEAMVKLANDWKKPQFPVRGDDLIKLGIKPGKDLGKLLSWGEKWWEEKHYKPAKKEILRQIERYKTAI